MKTFDSALAAVICSIALIFSTACQDAGQGQGRGQAPGQAGGEQIGVEETYGEHGMDVPAGDATQDLPTHVPLATPTPEQVR
jgi:hypothetical protein